MFYPVSLRVEGLGCLVVGGGPVGARKVEGLLAAGAIVTVVAPDVCDALDLSAVTWHARQYLPSDLDGMWLAITATSSAAVNAAVFEDGRAARVWVNSADDPANCGFILPAVARTGPVTVAVSTGGHAPALAGWLRTRLAGSVGPEVSVVATALASVRAAVRSSGRSTEGLAWVVALDDEAVWQAARADDAAGVEALVRGHVLGD